MRGGGFKEFLTREICTLGVISHIAIRRSKNKTAQLFAEHYILGFPFLSEKQKLLLFGFLVEEESNPVLSCP